MPLTPGMVYYSAFQTGTSDRPRSYFSANGVSKASESGSSVPVLTTDPGGPGAGAGAKLVQVPAAQSL